MLKIKRLKTTLLLAEKFAAMAPTLTAKLAVELITMGHQVSERSVATLRKENGYSLQAMRKTKDGGDPENRDAQFLQIAAMVREFQAAGQPVVRVDAKQKELVGTFAHKGREWQPQGQPEAANVYDFIVRPAPASGPKSSTGCFRASA